MHCNTIRIVVFTIAGLSLLPTIRAQEVAPPVTPTESAESAKPVQPEEMDPQQVFNELFGGDVKRVRLTSSVADDMELAVQLLGSAETVASTPKLFAVICRESIHLASMDTAGLPIVLKAIEMLKKQGATLTDADFPSGLARLYQTAYVQSPSTKRGETGDKLIDVLLTYGSFLESLGEIDQAVVQYRRADTVARAIDWPQRASLSQRITDANSRKTLFAQIALLKKRLALNPKDEASAEELIFLYLFELDQPTAAQVTAKMLNDEAVTKQVSLASQPTESLVATDAESLGGWYEKLMARAKTDTAKANVLSRLVPVLDRSLALHAEQDLDRLRIKVKRDRFADELVSLEASLAKKGAPVAAKTPAVIDLVKLINPAKHAVRGEWPMQNGQIGQMPERRGATLRIPVDPQGDYEFIAEFTRAEGDRGLGFNLPLGDTSVALYLSYSGKTDGLSRVNRDDVRRNETSKPTIMTGHTRKKLAVRVVHQPGDQVQIQATLNGTTIVAWKGDRSALSRDSFIRLDQPLSLGIVGWESKVVYHKLQLRMLKGEAKTLTDADLQAARSR